MASKDIRVLRDTSNVALLNAIRNEQSGLYQSRVPKATQAGVRDVVENLTRFRPHWNEFVDALINRIGLTIARNKVWTNPLAEFKRGMLTYGDTIQEIQTGLLKSHVYDSDREYLERDVWGTESVPVDVNYHTVNRQEFYKITVNEPLLHRAFLESDGLYKFVNQILEAPTTSDQWDEFTITCQLFAEYERNGGFYKVNVPEISSLESNADEARVALRKMRALADTLPFISTKYNAAHMPTFAKREDMIVFATPEFQAAIDVEALAGAFNVNKADMYGRVITIPREYFNIDGCEAILTTSDFFVIADQLLENRSIQNPASLGTNYFLHHWEVISASRFVPAVMFTTHATDESIVVTEKPVSVTVELEDSSRNEAVRGGTVAFTATVNPQNEITAGYGINWSVGEHTSARTFITNNGVLHVGPDEEKAKLAVTAAVVYTDPENPRADAITGTYASGITVTGGTAPEWPAKGEVIGIRVKGVDVPSFKADTLTYTIAVPDGKATKGDVVVDVRDGVSTSVVIGKNGTEVSVTVDTSTSSAPVTYKITLTAQE